MQSVADVGTGRSGNSRQLPAIRNVVATRRESQGHVVSSLFVCWCPDRDSGDLLELSCCCVLDRSSFVVLSSSKWELMTVRREMGSNAEEEGSDGPGKCGKRSSWQRRSPSTVARSGTVALNWKRTFGRGRSVAGARRASRLCYKVNTPKQCRQRVVAAGLNRGLWRWRG